MKAKPWEKSAKRDLLDGIGFYGVEWFRRQGGAPYDYPNAPDRRSRKAVYAQARSLFGAGGLTRGVYTLNRLALETHYHPKQLVRAGGALNQKWKRMGPRGVHLLTDEQVEDLLEWLKHDFWSKALRLYSCSWCSTQTRPHKGAGLCSKCYFKHRTLCRRLGIPKTTKGQLAWVAAALRKPPRSALALDCLGKMRARLATRKSLPREQLQWVKKLGRRTLR